MNLLREVVKEVEGSVDIEVKNVYWNDGFVKTVMNVSGRYDVDIFKNEDGVVINRVYAKDGKCLVQVKYIIYEEDKGYRTLRYLYIVKNKQQEVEA